MRLSEISSDTALHVERDGEFRSLGFVTHRRAGLLVYFNDRAYATALLDNPLVSAVLATAELADLVPPHLSLGITGNPRESFYDLHEHLACHTSFYGESHATRISPSAHVHESAVVSDRDVEIGDDVTIGACVVVLPGVRVGARSVIRAGVVLGSEGFQVVSSNSGIRRVTHAGRVVIGEDVDIHSNTCVDRSVFGETIIGGHTTIDNLVYVAHDVVIGTNCRIVAHAMLAGSSHIGNGAWIGPSASISSGVTVGDGAYVTLGSVVTRDVAPGAHVTGNFAIDHERYLAFLRTIR